MKTVENENFVAGFSVERDQLIDGLTEEELMDRLYHFNEAIAFSKRAFGFYLLDFDRRGLYQKHGCSGTVQFAVLKFQLLPKTTRDYLRIARALEELELIDEAFEKRKISWSAVREITRVATPETEEGWLEFAQSNPIRRTEIAVSCVKRGERPPEDHYRISKTRFKIFAHMAAADYAVWEEAFARLSAKSGGDLSTSTALRLLAEWYLEQPLTEEDREARRPYQVVYHRCSECSRAWLQTDAGPVGIDPVHVEEKAGNSRVTRLDSGDKENVKTQMTRLDSGNEGKGKGKAQVARNGSGDEDGGRNNRTSSFVCDAPAGAWDSDESGKQGKSRNSFVCDAPAGAWYSGDFVMQGKRTNLYVCDSPPEDWRSDVLEKISVCAASHRPYAPRKTYSIPIHNFKSWCIRDTTESWHVEEEIHESREVVTPSTDLTKPTPWPEPELMPTPIPLSEFTPSLPSLPRQSTPETAWVPIELRDLPNPPSLSQQVSARDGQVCAVPGCLSRTNLAAHHVLWRCHGGPTVADNLICLCSRCHSLIHEGFLCAVASPRLGLMWIDINGCVLDDYTTSKRFQREKKVS